MQLAPSLRQHLVSGVVAAVIYMLISAVTGADLTAVLVGGIVVGAITVVVASVITRMLAGRRSGR